MKLVTVVGARPQFIKAAALRRAIDTHNRAAEGSRVIEDVLVHTGQHYDYEMSRVFFEELDLPAPHYELGVGSGSHGAQTGRMLEEVETVLLKEAPCTVLVYGDTNSTLAGALAAAKLHLPVAHVEAGLRSYNRAMPEEVNRVLTDHVSTWLFCPTEPAVANLAREGIRSGVRLVGDVMHGLLGEHAATAPRAALAVRLRLPQRGYALATVHRAENTASPARLTGIFQALVAIAGDLPIVWPLHPRTREGLRCLALTPSPRLHLADPLSYLEMLALARDAALVLTDSGGVQKEAYWLGVPCVILRDETEWGDTLVEGRNVLAGADAARIERAARAALAADAMAPPPVAPRGAAGAIVATLVEESS